MERFSALLAICVENSPMTGEFPVQGPVTRSFDVFPDLRLNKLLSKQCWVNNGETVDLRRHRVRYDVIVLMQHACVQIRRKKGLDMYVVRYQSYLEKYKAV